MNDTAEGDVDRRAIANAIGATLNEDLWPLVEEWSEVEYTSAEIRGTYWSCAKELGQAIEDEDK